MYTLEYFETISSLSSLAVCEQRQVGVKVGVGAEHGHPVRVLLQHALYPLYAVLLNVIAHVYEEIPGTACVDEVIMAAVILKASSIAFPVAYLFFAEVAAEIIVEGVVVLYVVVAGADPCGYIGDGGHGAHGVFPLALASIVVYKVACMGNVLQVQLLLRVPQIGGHGVEDIRESVGVVLCVAHPCDGIAALGLLHRLGHGGRRGSGWGGGFRSCGGLGAALQRQYNK